MVFDDTDTLLPNAYKNQKNESDRPPKITLQINLFTNTRNKIMIKILEITLTLQNCFRKTIGLIHQTTKNL